MTTKHRLVIRVNVEVCLERIEDDAFVRVIEIAKCNDNAERVEDVVVATGVHYTHGYEPGED